MQRVRGARNAMPEIETPINSVQVMRENALAVWAITEFYLESH